MTKTAKKEINSISLDFEIPMFICSGMNIRFLRVFERGRGTSLPFRWVRYITHRSVETESILDQSNVKNCSS